MGSPKIDAVDSTHITASTREEYDKKKLEKVAAKKKADEEQALQQGLAGNNTARRIIINLYNRLLEAKESLPETMAAQGLYGAAISTPKAVSYATHGETRSAFNEAAKESLKDTKANWKDFVWKSSEKYKNDQAYRRAVDDLFKKLLNWKEKQIRNCIKKYW